jgi:transcription elongation factor Elf1
MFECKICNKSYSVKSTLKRHLIDVHAQDEQSVRTELFRATIKCSKCHNTFNNRKQLNTHFQQIHLIDPNINKLTFNNEQGKLISNFYYTYLINFM